jgi:hypothetical protein
MSMDEKYTPEQLAVWRARLPYHLHGLDKDEERAAREDGWQRISRATHDIATVVLYASDGPAAPVRLGDEARAEAEAALERRGHVVRYVTVGEAKEWTNSATGEEAETLAGWYLFRREGDMFVDGAGEYLTRDDALASFLQLDRLLSEDEESAPAP